MSILKLSKYINKVICLSDSEQENDQSDELLSRNESCDESIEELTSDSKETSKNESIEELTNDSKETSKDESDKESKDILDNYIYEDLLSKDESKEKKSLSLINIMMHMVKYESIFAYYKNLLIFS